MKKLAICLIVFQVFFYNADGSFGYNKVYAPENLPPHHQAWVIFSEIFNNNFDFVPSDVCMLWAHYCKLQKLLTINVSDSIMNYGGTYFEYRFVNLLIKNALNINGVQYFTLLIEGESKHLPEGVKIYREFFSCQG